MKSKVAVYRHETPSTEKFVGKYKAELNVPKCGTGIEPHLDIQVDDISLHIPLQDVRDALTGKTVYIDLDGPKRELPHG